MKKTMPPAMKSAMKGGKAVKKPPFGKRDAEDAMPDGEAAPSRADRPARKSGGAMKKGC